jgi:hypothetical protein
MRRFVLRRNSTMALVAAEVTSLFCVLVDLVQEWGVDHEVDAHFAGGIRRLVAVGDDGVSSLLFVFTKPASRFVFWFILIPSNTA